MKTLDEFIDTFGTREPLVILLEGSRSIPDDWAERARQLGALLARKLPKAVLRTGNATGSDTAFATGVAEVDASRLEYVVPHESHRKKDRAEGARVLAMASQDESRAREVMDLSVTATPTNRNLVANYRRIAAEQRRGWEQKKHAQAELLLRDALKVVGCKDAGHAPATVALFYLEPDGRSGGGGTGHTIRCCDERGVPAFTQEVWGAWLESN